MNTISTHKKSLVSINIISAFLILALLRLLPFNFFASVLVGHDVVIDNREGNAINFINYIATAFLFLVAFLKLPWIRAKWSELWPFAVLILIYTLNLLGAPYVNPSWVLYQFAFILIASLIHILLSGQSDKEYEKTLLQGGFMLFIVACIGFLAFVFLRMYFLFSPSYILSEFNDSFINSVNSFGLMKQYYGYVVGFLIIYGSFVLKSSWKKCFIFLFGIMTAFGIRSLILGLCVVLFFKNIRRPIILLFSILLLLISGILLWESLVLELLYDTRFYAYMNGWDIIQRFPLGVGLGGYPVYTEIYNSDLFASFFTIDAALNYVPNSPESDLVHVFGSLGLWLGLVHLFIQLRVIILGLVREPLMRPFEKSMLYYFIFMTAFGISEDTMFTVSYWVFFGVASGVVATVGKRRNNA